jgi:hypothetical protein
MYSTHGAARTMMLVAGLEKLHTSFTIYYLITDLQPDLHLSVVFSSYMIELVGGVGVGYNKWLFDRPTMQNKLGALIPL